MLLVFLDFPSLARTRACQASRPVPAPTSECCLGPWLFSFKTHRLCVWGDEKGLVGRTAHRLGGAWCNAVA